MRVQSVHKDHKVVKVLKAFREQWVVKALQDFLEFKDSWALKVSKVHKDVKVLKEFREQQDVRVQ